VRRVPGIPAPGGGGPLPRGGEAMGGWRVELATHRIALVVVLPGMEPNGKGR
jgi:hypothetical protein